MKSWCQGQNNDNLLRTNFDLKGLLELSALWWAKKCILASVTGIEIIEILFFVI